MSQLHIIEVPIGRRFVGHTYKCTRTSNAWVNNERIKREYVLAQEESNLEHLEYMVEFKAFMEEKEIEEMVKKEASNKVTWHIGYVGTTSGMTLNLQNYESAKAESYVCLPIPVRMENGEISEEQVKEAHERAVALIGTLHDSVAEQLTATVNQVVSSRRGV